jgi:NAD(P)-dependent dehydrogenase (short-subunit alcohol dehydrogenase family)
VSDRCPCGIDDGHRLANEYGPHAHHHRVEVASAEDVSSRILGTTEDSTAWSTTPEYPANDPQLPRRRPRFSEVMPVNLLGVLLGTREAPRYMAIHSGGRIINISTIGGLQAGGGVMTLPRIQSRGSSLQQKRGHRTGAARSQHQLYCSRRHLNIHPRLLRPRI